MNKAGREEVGNRTYRTIDSEVYKRGRTPFSLGRSEKGVRPLFGPVKIDGAWLFSERGLAGLVPSERAQSA